MKIAYEGSTQVYTSNNYLNTIKVDSMPRAFYPTVTDNQEIVVLPWTPNPLRYRLYFIPGSVKNRTLSAYVRDRWTKSVKKSDNSIYIVSDE